MKVPITEAVRITGLSESTNGRRRRRRPGRHDGGLRTGGVSWMNVLVILAFIALAAAGGVGVAMYTYAVW